MIELCLLGTGGMVPLAGRYLTALYARHAGRALLIDCGECTQVALRVAGMRFKCVEGICLTHYHADHVSGLPGFLLTLGNEGRVEPLALYGPPGLERVVRALRVIAPELPYQVTLRELPPQGGAFDLAGMRVAAFPLAHGAMPCFGYRAELKRARRFEPERAQTLGVPLALWSRLQQGEDVDGFRSAEVLGPPRRGLAFLYATDTRPVPAIAEYGDSVDLMVLEGMFGDPDKLARAVETNHMMMAEAVALAVQAGARALWLTHFSPATQDPAAYWEELSKGFPGLRMGEDGMKTTLCFDEE